MNFVNCTPHAINIVTSAGIVTIPKGAVVARCAATTSVVGEVNGIPLTRTSFGEVVDLPGEVEGTMLIVSMLVRSALPGRTDLASPGELVRDEAGTIIGCRGLVVN